MKLKYERFEGLGCFSIRGVVDVPHLKLVSVGLESMVPHIDETLLVNLSNATLNDPLVVKTLVDLKKKLPTMTKQKIYWICKEKTIGDFPNTDLFISRLTGFKFRQIGERIKIDDQLYAVTEEVKYFEAKIHELGGDEANAQKVIIENKVLKSQKRILEESVHWHENRLKHQHAVPPPPTEVDFPQKIVDAEKTLKEPLKTYLGTEVDL